MNRQRFNQLLNDPSLVENNDIRQLNEYRKKYPYFQGLYVIVAKALKDREHPKTDAFIKKAAIYSSNRSHLKSIIEGDDFFSQIVEKEVIEKEQAKPDNTSKEQKPIAVEQPPAKEPIDVPEPKKEAESVDKEEEKVDSLSTEPLKPTAVQKEDKPKEASEPKEKTEPSNETEEVVEEPESDESASDGNDPIIDELKATKARIEALLRGELPKEEVKEEPIPITEAKPAKSKSRSKKDSQIDIIQKFLDDDPQIDIKKKALIESEQAQKDLAENSLKESDKFETETVAKLMIKQGKFKKGIEIYEKLGLKFPEKRTYFAAQIEKLKSKHNV